MQVIYRSFPFRTFGVELEVVANVEKQEIGGMMQDFESKIGGHRAVDVTFGSAGWAESIGNDYWHVKYDSTCGMLGKGKDYGWEVASYIASGVSDLHRISKAAHHLKASGCMTSSHCGLHIHVGTSDFTLEQMGIALARWLKVEPWLMQICDKSRKNNAYCKSMHKVMKDRMACYYHNNPSGFWSEMRPWNLESHENKDKKVTFNMVGFTLGCFYSTHRRNTVELRMPECRLEQSHVRNWIRLFTNFVEVSKKAPPPINIEPASDIQEALHYLGLAEKDQFIVLDRELAGAKMWFLQRLMTVSKHRSKSKKHLDFVCKI